MPFSFSELSRSCNVFIGEPNMLPSLKLCFRSKCNINPDALWISINCIKSLNRELRPVMYMTCPNDYKEKPFDEYPAGIHTFKSYVLFLGFIPIERTNIKMIQIFPGRGFSEDSTMIFSSSWKHKRILISDGDGTIVTDELDITHRLIIFKPVLWLFANMIFFVRHGKLKKMRKGFNTARWSRNKSRK